MVHGTAQPLGSPTPRAARGGTQPAPPAKTRADPLLFTGDCYLFIMVCSILLFDCTGESPGDLQRAWGVIHPVWTPETRGAGWHPIPAPVGRLPAARGKGSSYKYL